MCTAASLVMKLNTTLSRCIYSSLLYLFLLVVHSVRSVLGSQVFLEVLVHPAALEHPVGQALLGVPAQCGWTQADWVRGSG